MTAQDTITTHLKEARRFEPERAFVERARIRSREDYERLYRESIESPDSFWKRETSELIFRKPWDDIHSWDLPHARFFEGAKLNITESCLDRHLAEGRGDKTAIIWEGEPAENRSLSYRELYESVVRCASALIDFGVRPGDRVTIYMGMVPEVVIAMLACARIGAVHNVVFGGFAADALRDRMRDCGSKILITQDGAFRRGQVIRLKEMADKAVAEAPSIEKVIVYQRVGSQRLPISLQAGRDFLWDELMASATKEGKDAIEVDAEHPLFVLHTSGSTGKPKGVLHTTAGYLASVHVTMKYVFDLREDDIYFCTADVGWVTGHSYLVYGPLSNGATCFMYEGAPNYPDNGRFWKMIEDHRISIFYTAPTAIRAFIRWGEEWPKKYDLSSLRLLGTVGEPINPDAWVWYHDKIGGGKCPIVDTWWQTETGAIMLATLPGAAPQKPGSTGLPLFGIVPDIVKRDGEPVAPNEGGLLVIRKPWPAMVRNLWGDEERFRAQYFGEISGLYFSGDGARRDEDGYYWVVGRIDDVLNISGHRIGTAEIESALVSHAAVAEAAAVGRPDDLKGQSLVVFVVLKPEHEASEELSRDLVQHVEREIGRFARPDAIRFAEALPKTRSGKIMRRLLKDIAAGVEAKGDLSTLEDKGVLAHLRTAPEDD